MLNEKLIMLEQDRDSLEEDVIETPSTQLQLTTNHLSQSFDFVEVVQILSANDPRRELNLKVTRGLHDIMHYYKEKNDIMHYYKEKMQQKQQTTLDAFFVKRAEPTPHQGDYEDDDHELLGGESIAGINMTPTSVAASRENIHRILQYLVTKQVNMPVTNVKDIVEGDLKSIMKLVHVIAAHYKPASIQTPSSVRNTPSTSQRSSDTEFLYTSTDGDKHATKPEIVIDETRQQATFQNAVPSSDSKEKKSKIMNTVGSKDQEHRWLCTTIQQRKELVPEKQNYISGFGKNLHRHLTLLDTQRLVNGGGEVDGASSSGSPTPTETSWPQSAGQPDLSCEDYTEIFPSHFGRHLVDIRQLSEDVRKSKHQLLVLREVVREIIV
ncbi:uncharacterized protein LOC106472841 [Limulus polyphemus]|uniref:Uncharacterized protein LOC106472841 n=1 Tax=Limulus polyphemus TaxID=6850 RepID=A0ABM1TMI5_LIMPO|nr:uncharacterized protein LOC106472841 [Limulus polyphemus]